MIAVVLTAHIIQWHYYHNFVCRICKKKVHSLRISFYLKVEIFFYIFIVLRLFADQPRTSPSQSHILKSIQYLSAVYETTDFFCFVNFSREYLLIIDQN